MQGLQWVLSGYLLTYGGFMLLGGRAGDLLGRRRVLVTGTSLFGVSSLVGGFAGNPGICLALGSRRVWRRDDAPGRALAADDDVQGGTDRHKALGIWGGVGGLASTAGVPSAACCHKDPDGAGCCG